MLLLCDGFFSFAVARQMKYLFNYLVIAAYN
jgi:hypothetical protein